MIRSITVILLHTFLVQAHATELQANRTGSEQHSADKLAERLVDSLVDRVVSLRSHRADLDGTTLAKNLQEALDGTTSAKTQHEDLDGTTLVTSHQVNSRGVPHARVAQPMFASSSSSTLASHPPQSRNTATQVQAVQSDQDKMGVLQMLGLGPPAMETGTPSHLNDPTQRDSHYGKPLNVAQYLVDMHDTETVFNFCGHLPFQLSLSPKLREHLGQIAQEGGQSKQQPVIFDASAHRLEKTPGYTQTAEADNLRIFHGREVRDVPTAKGGAGCVLQLAMANGDDPEGWTKHEIADYNGWKHDTGRPWRKGGQHEREGFASFKSKFGDSAYTLHHRFYLHFDRRNQMWLSAEDGCEGEPWN